MKNYFLVNHPLIQHKLSYLRQVKTGPKEFRAIMEELTILLLYEATRNLPVIETEVESPVGRARGKAINDKNAFIAILRAGQGMINGALKLIPSAKVGMVGIYRDEKSLEPVQYYCNLPSDLNQRNCYILDPMLATGGTSAEVIRLAKEEGVTNIKIITIIASPEGLNHVLHTHSDVEVYLAAVDQGLDANAFIVPGLGDAGDRLFGTV